MSDRSGWKCGACLCCGMIEHDEHASVYEVLHTLSRQHEAVSPSCALDLSSIHVWKIPASGERGTP